MKGFNIGKIVLKPLAEEDKEWDETKQYYEEYIYYDMYWIFDFIKDKWKSIDWKIEILFAYKNWELFTFYPNID